MKLPLITMSSNDLHQRVEQLESRIDTLEGLFSQRIIDKELAHVQAKQRDARDELQVGETYRVYIQDVESNGPNQQGVGRIGGIVTFVTPGSVDFQQGDTIKVQITDVKENAAEARAIE